MTLLSATEEARAKLEAENKVLANAITILSGKLNARRDISKRRLEVVTDLRENLVALREANQRLRQANSVALIRIEDLKKQIAQRDEEMRLLLCDVHKTEGHVVGVEHIGGAPNRFTVSKIAGLQNKNQEIGSQLGYYKSETYKLRTMLVNAQASRDAWKRKYHGTLHASPVDFADRTVGVIV